MNRTKQYQVERIKRKNYKGIPFLHQFINYFLNLELRKNFDQKTKTCRQIQATKDEEGKKKNHISN